MSAHTSSCEQVALARCCGGAVRSGWRAVRRGAAAVGGRLNPFGEDSALQTTLHYLFYVCTTMRIK